MISYGGFSLFQIYANPITESVEMLPIVLYNDDVEFDNTFYLEVWQCLLKNAIRK